MTGGWSDQGPALRLLTPEAAFRLLFLFPVRLDSGKRSKAGFSPAGSRLLAPAPVAAPRDRPGVLPPRGALWAAAGLVAGAVAAAARLKGAAGGAQGLSARDGAAAMGKGHGPTADAGPGVLG